MTQGTSLARENKEPDGKPESEPAPVKGFDQPRIEAAVREILIAIGEDPDRDGLRDTPARVARAYAEQFAGLRQRPEDVLTTVFDVGHDEMVIVRDIEVYGTCEHHLVPFIGVATSATSRTSRARSPGCPSWPGWWMCTPAARRYRSG